jgi:hypothetical protein
MVYMITYVCDQFYCNLNFIIVYFSPSYKAYGFSISITFGMHAFISELWPDIDEFYIVLEHFVYPLLGYVACYSCCEKHNHVCPFAHFTF